MKITFSQPGRRESPSASSRSIGIVSGVTRIDAGWGHGLAIKNGNVYTYFVTAVNKQGAQSGPSNYLTVTITTK